MLHVVGGSDSNKKELLRSFELVNKYCQIPANYLSKDARPVIDAEINYLDKFLHDSLRFKENKPYYPEIFSALCTITYWRKITSDSST